MTERVEPERTATGWSADAERRPAAGADEAVTLPSTSHVVVGADDDAAEREADAAAEVVVRRLGSGGQPPDVPSDRAQPSSGDDASSGSAGGSIRRGVVRRGDTAHREGRSPGSTRLVRRSTSAVGPEGGRLDDDTSSRIVRAAGGGRPLVESVRTPMEDAFGAGLGHVRIHRGPEADRLNRSMSARAFTAGSDVFFANGQYDPHSTGGRRTLAHELTHVLQNQGVTRRAMALRRKGDKTGSGAVPERRYKRFDTGDDRGLDRDGGKEKGPWGFGTKGRKRSDQDQMIADATSTPEAAASQIHKVLRSKTTREFTRFKKLIKLLSRPDAAQVADEYQRLDDFAFSLKQAIDDRFSDAFRREYLKALLSGGGLAPPLLRVRLALGAGGGGKRSVISDPNEAMRLMYGLSYDDHNELRTKYREELVDGMSMKALQQIKFYFWSQAEDQESGAGAAPLKVDNVRPLLESQDAELATIVRRSKFAEGSSISVDVFSPQFVFAMDTFIDRVAEWVERAKKLEAKRFAGAPIIRRYVLAASDLRVPVPRGVTVVTNTERKFLGEMGSQTFMRGWNDGDRQAILLMIASGAKAPTGTTGTTASTGGQTPAPGATEFGDVGIASKGDPALQARLQQVIGRLTDPKAIKAMSFLAGEITTQKTKGASSRVKRLIAAFVSIDSSVGKQIYDAIINQKVDPANAEKAQELARGEMLTFLSAAKVKPKEQHRIIAQLEPQRSKENLVALERHAWKSSFSSKQFARLVAQLDAEEREVVKKSPDLLRQIVLQYQRVIDFLMGVDEGFGVGGSFETYYQSEVAPTMKVLGVEIERRGGRLAGATAVPKAPESDDEQATKQAEYADWAARWALHISTTKQAKKMLAFAVQVLGGVGNEGLCAVYKVMKASYPDEAAHLRRTTELGKELDMLLTSGHAMMLDRDIIANTISEATTVRLGGKADVDTIVSTFENLSGKALLDHWTNIDEFQSMLFRRKLLLNQMNTAMVEFGKRKDQGRPATDKEISGRFGPFLDQLARYNQHIAATFWLGMSDKRRKQLNTGARQVQTSEFHTIAGKFSAHLAKEIVTPEMKEALVDRGLMSSELATAGERVQFVGAQTKEAAMSTWHQWSAITVKGLLREESAARLGRNMRKLDSVASGGTTEEIATARKDFAGSLKELKERTKSFEKTARKYTERLKTIISVILDIVIMAATLGIGTVPVLINTAIQAAFSFAKDVVLSVIDKWAMPTESNLASDITVALIKTTLKAGADLGLGQLQGIIDQQLRLVDANGLTGGTYAISDGAGGYTLIESSAIKATSGFKDMTAQHFFTKVGSDTIAAFNGAVVEKISDTLTRSITTDGTAAFKNFLQQWSWTDLVEIGLKPVTAQLIDRGTKEFSGRMREALGVEGTKTTTVNGKRYNVIEPNSMLERRGGHSAFDSQFTSVNVFDPSFGLELSADLIDKAVDDAFVDFLWTLHDAPVEELGAMLDRKRQVGDEHEAKGTKEKPGAYNPSDAQATAIATFDQLCKAAGVRHDPKGLARFIRQLLSSISAEKTKQSTASTGGSDD